MPTVQPHAADRLLEAIDRCRAPVCVGIDPVVERLPHTVDAHDPVEAMRVFTHGILDALVDVVPCVKFQSACYERYGYEGVRVLEEAIREAKSRNFEVILDAKRGDIGISAQHYAAAAFGETQSRDREEAPKRGETDTSNTLPYSRGSDWITVNAYLGADGIEPFLVDGRGAFALVRTSNPGGDALQSQKLASGETVAEAVAKIVAELGEQTIGHRGFSSLGAVVGATKPEDAARLRELMPNQIFLVPGYGAQGGSAKDVLPCFGKDASGGRTGAIVTASRSVIYAFDPHDAKWINTVRDAAKQFADEIRTITNQ